MINLLNCYGDRKKLAKPSFVEKVVRPTADFTVQYWRRLIWVPVVAAVLHFSLGSIGQAEQERNRVTREYNQAYHQALHQYADANSDGFVSHAEKDAFDRRLLEDKGVTLIAGTLPVYEDGTTVPLETLTGWVRDYKPE